VKNREVNSYWITAGEEITFDWLKLVRLTLIGYWLVTWSRNDLWLDKTHEVNGYQL